MPVVDGDILRVSASFKDQFLSDVVNVYHIEVTGVTTGDETAWWDFISGWVEEMYLAIDQHIPSTVVTNAISVFNETQGVPLGSQAWPTLTAGTSANTEELPAGVAALLVGRTGFSRRVAKKYLPVFTEGSLSDGRWDSAARAAMLSMAIVWRASQTDVLTGTFRAGVYGGVPPTFAPIISAYAAIEPAYQRRRRPGRGS